MGESPFNLSSCIPTLKVDTPKECCIFKMRLEKWKYVWVKWSWYQWKLGLNDGFWVKMIKNKTWLLTIQSVMWRSKWYLNKGVWNLRVFLHGLYDNYVTYVWRMCSLGVMNPLKIMGCKSVLISKRDFWDLWEKIIQT